MTDIGTDLALTIVRVAVGVLIAGHGAQKLFGAFGGQGLERWQGAVASMGFAQPRLFAALAAFAEFFGGIALAIGLLVPIACAVIVVDLAVAIVKVHAAKGPWVTKGGYEYALALLVAVAALGLAGATPYSIDFALGLGDSALLFIVLTVIGGLVTAGAAMATQGTHRTA